VSRFGVLDGLRDNWLASVGLVLAGLSLVFGLLPGHGAARTTVLAARHALAAGAIVREADVTAVPIATADRTPSMISRLDDLTGRRTLIGLSGGDFVVRGAFRAGDAPAPLRRGERAVPLELATGSAPDVRLLRRGRLVDVVIVDAAGSRVAARALEILSPASDHSGTVSVTLRAPATVALALAGARVGREVQLLLRGDLR
jgi:hypothetical protein